jgi:hypothetical protein
VDKRLLLTPDLTAVKFMWVANDAIIQVNLFLHLVLVQIDLVDMPLVPKSLLLVRMEVTGWTWRGGAVRLADPETESKPQSIIKALLFFKGSIRIQLGIVHPNWLAYLCRNKFFFCRIKPVSTRRVSWGEVGTNFWLPDAGCQTTLRMFMSLPVESFLYELTLSDQT